MKLLSVLFTLASLSSPIAKAEGFADIMHAYALEKGIEHAFDKQRARNRADTEFQWDQADVQFPCADAIRKAREAKKLPIMTVNGERHDAPYCQARLGVLKLKHAEADGAVCLAIEHLDFTKDSKNAKGLENADAKAMTLLFSAYEDLLRPATDKKSYGGVMGLLDVMYKPSVAKIWKDNVAKFRREHKDLAIGISLLDQAAATGEGAIGASSQAGWAEMTKKNGAKVAPIVKKLITLLAQHIESESKDGTFAGEPLPKGFALEIAFATRDIERAVANPTSRLALQAMDKRSDYLALRWRDRLMARNIAKLYCDNLEAAKPKTDFQVIVGQDHVRGITQLLGESAFKNNIDVYMVNGAALSNQYDFLVGTPDKETGKYPDQGLALERNNGVPFALSKQVGGARITVFMNSKQDPLKESPLHTRFDVRVWGPAGALQKHLGLPEDKPVPGEKLKELGREMIAEFHAPAKK